MTYTCPHCSKPYPTPGGLHAHHRAEHRGIPWLGSPVPDSDAPVLSIPQIARRLGVPEDAVAIRAAIVLTPACADCPCDKACPRFDACQVEAAEYETDILKAFGAEDFRCGTFGADEREELP